MKNEEYFEPENEDMALFEARLDRRQFLKDLGGITILFCVGVPEAEAQRRRDYPRDLNAYLNIGEDGRVTCFSGKIEMGQGIITSLAQMLAEELEVPLESVDMIMGDTDLCPYDSATVGSRSTKYFGPPLRRAAAEAKAVLLGLAADHFKIPEERLAVKEGIISEKGNPDRRISYAQIAKGVRLERRLEGEAPIKHYSEHTISGRPALRTDARAKVTGEAKFTGDIRLPGMLYAGVLRPPAHGASLKSVDVSRAKKIPGLLVVEENDLVAVLHELPDVADMAIEKIRAEWDVPEPLVNNNTILEYLQNFDASADVVTEKGDVSQGKSLAAQSFESTFLNHYVAHAPIETYTAVAEVTKEKVRIWASTQSPFGVREAVARTLSVPVEKVQVRTPFVGGGFGGKKVSPPVLEASSLARLTGRPVQIAFSRKEEFFYDSFRPAAVIILNSGIDRSGRIVYWEYDNLFAGSRSSHPVYDIPHYRVLSRRSRRVHPFNTGAWRGPGSNSNVFAMESQIDVMAQAAGIDPLSFRLKNLNNERMKKVLLAAADKFDREFAKGPSGKGYGLACTDYLGTYVVTMAEVEVDKDSGKVRVVRIVCAQDMGEIINPQGARLQIEGGLTMGIGYVLSEEVRFKGGRILDESFDTYEMPRFSWAPEIETVLVDNPEMAPQGCGEPAITTTGGVIANAIYDAVGVRFYRLPITPGRITEIVKKD